MENIKNIQIPLETLAQLERVLAKAKGCRFASLTYRAKGTGEVARHVVLLGVSLENAYKADLETLEKLFPSLSGAKAIACGELIESIKNSLEKGIGQNDSYTKKGLYEYKSPGLKMLSSDGTFEILGLTVSKKVLIPGEYKEVKSRNEVTAAKKELRKVLKAGKIRTFAVDAETFAKAQIRGEEIVLE